MLAWGAGYSSGTGGGTASSHSAVLHGVDGAACPRKDATRGRDDDLERDAISPDRYFDTKQVKPKALN